MLCRRQLIKLYLATNAAYIVGRIYATIYKSERSSFRNRSIQRGNLQQLPIFVYNTNVRKNFDKTTRKSLFFVLSSCFSLFSVHLDRFFQKVLLLQNRQYALTRLWGSLPLLYKNKTYTLWYILLRERRVRENIRDFIFLIGRIIIFVPTRLALLWGLGLFYW